MPQPESDKYDVSHFIEPQNEVPYNREAASLILLNLSRVAVPEDLSTYMPEDLQTIEYQDKPITFSPDSLLTKQQIQYYEKHMSPECPIDGVTSATNHIFWTDSEGVINAGFYKAGEHSLGPIVPIAARETMLVLTRALQNPAFQSAVNALAQDEREILAGTTTDKVPQSIFRVGYDSAAKAVGHLALLAGETQYRTPQTFVRGMLDSGLFRFVATDYYWELQTSTYKRRMVPGHLETVSRMRVRFTNETIQALHRMKRKIIYEAKALTHRAITEEGLTLHQAIAKYHGELDQAAEQYIRLPNGEFPYCLGMMRHKISGEATPESAFDYIGYRFVETFEKVLERLSVKPVST